MMLFQLLPAVLMSTPARNRLGVSMSDGYVSAWGGTATFYAGYCHVTGGLSMTTMGVSVGVWR